MGNFHLTLEDSERLTDPQWFECKKRRTGSCVSRRQRTQLEGSKQKPSKTLSTAGSATPRSIDTVVSLPSPHPGASSGSCFFRAVRRHEIPRSNLIQTTEHFLGLSRPIRHCPAFNFYYLSARERRASCLHQQSSWRIYQDVTTKSSLSWPSWSSEKV